MESYRTKSSFFKLCTLFIDKRKSTQEGEESINCPDTVYQVLRSPGIVLTGVLNNNMSQCSTKHALVYVVVFVDRHSAVRRSLLLLTYS